MIAAQREAVRRAPISYAESPFTRFFETRPRAPICSDDVHRGVTIRERAVALGMRYVQVGGPVPYQAYLVFDVDLVDAAKVWAAKDFLCPTFCVTNPETGHAHLFYELAIPLARFPYASDQLRFAAAVERGITMRLGADECYTGLTAQNPLSRHWIVQAANVRYDLREIAKRLTPEEMGRRRRSRGLGRNCDLFDETRFQAYLTVREFDSESAFADAIAKYALERNRALFADPLTDKETSWVAKSVAKWTWTRRERYVNAPKRPRRGAMGFEALPTIMDATEKLAAIRSRQVASGPATRAAVRDATRARIQVAVLDLIAEEKRPSAAAVARRTGIHAQTVRRHRDLLAGDGKVVVLPTARRAKSERTVYSGVAASVPGPEAVPNAKSERTVYSGVAAPVLGPEAEGPARG